MRACETVTNSRWWRGRSSAAVVTALAATVVLGGCAAGQHAQTEEQYSTVDGASGDLGAIGLRNAGVAAPTTNAGYAVGADAQLVMAMVNNSATADKLVSVTSTAAAGVVISKATSGTASPGPVTGSGGGSPSPGPGPSSSDQSSGQSPSSQSAPSTPATAPPSSDSATPTPVGGTANPTASGPVTIPANGLVEVGPGTPADTVITMTGLKQALSPGLTVPVTFAFASAGRITLQLPVRLIPDNTGGATISVSPTGD